MRADGDDGITDTLIFLLPPGATNEKQAIATVTTGPLVDTDLAFTASATGTFTLRIEAVTGSGSIAVTGTAIGTAMERAPRLIADGLPHPLSISCYMLNCAFEYDGATMLDADGSGFDLMYPHAEAGRAYAFLIEMTGHKAAQVTATFYQVGAAAGSTGFHPVVMGPMGEWTATPAGHDSLAELSGCSNEDRSCIQVPASFGIYPGHRPAPSKGQECTGSPAGWTDSDGDPCDPPAAEPDPFPQFLTGNWVAPASGPVMLRLVLNCDIPYLADAQAPGCYSTAEALAENGYGCAYTISEDRQHSTKNSKCGPEPLRLTVTPGAYFAGGGQAGHRRVLQTGGDQLQHTGDTHAPSLGTFQRTDRILIERANVEAQSTAAWEATPAEQRVSAAPPSLEEMLVSGSEANTLLNSMFTVEQEPYVVYPLDFHIDGGKDKGNGSGHRRLQKQGDHLTVVIETHAPSPFNADQAEQRLIDGLPGSRLSEGRRRRVQVGADQSQNADGLVCGLGSTDAGCTASGQTKRQITLVVAQDDIEAQAAALWQSEQTSGGRRLQMSGDQLTHPIDSHAPTLGEMLISDTPANDLLSRIFVQEQQPQVAFPIGFTLEDGSGKHRRLQAGGDLLQVTIDTHAATPAEADKIVHRLMTATRSTLSPDAVIPHGIGSCELTDRTRAVNDECCNEPTEDCSSGRPAVCNAGCARIVLPFFDDCYDALGERASDFDSVVALCREALGGGRRIMQPRSEPGEELRRP